MRAPVAITLAATAFVPAAAVAQEPSHLERLAGDCRLLDGAALGAYAGRVLWTADGQFSGMLTRVSESPGADVAPRSITIARQAPVEADNGWTISAEVGDAAVVCTLSHVEAPHG